MEGMTGEMLNIFALVGKATYEKLNYKHVL